ncbi:hypothetical protein EDD11_005551 [Mortierella claussenii]|nr:hypothetical protein EDD11_005551 [Mortierella claussenii]
MRASSTQESISTGLPYGAVSDDNKNGNLMLIVSLVVVFVVLSGMGVVVCCLLHRRSAKRRLHLFGKSPNPASSTTGLDQVFATKEQRRSSSHLGHESLGTPGGPDGRTRRPSDVDMSRALQEMTEQHQSTLLSRRSSTLSLGSGLQGLAGRPSSRVLSPTMMPARSYSQSSGYWGGVNGGIVPTSGHEYYSGPIDPTRDHRNSQFDEYYGVANTSQQLVYPGAVSGMSEYSSNEQLILNKNRRSSRSPGPYPTAEIIRSPSRNSHISGHASLDHPLYTNAPIPMVGSSLNDTYAIDRSMVDGSQDEQSLMRPKSMTMLQGLGQTGVREPMYTPPADGLIRPHSMMTPGGPSNLVIPPSITTRPRSSMMSSNNMYQAQYYSSQQFQHSYFYPYPHDHYGCYPTAGSYDHASSSDHLSEPIQQVQKGMVTKGSHGAEGSQFSASPASGSTAEVKNSHQNPAAFGSSSSSTAAFIEKSIPLTR